MAYPAWENYSLLDEWSLYNPIQQFSNTFDVNYGVPIPEHRIAFSDEHIAVAISSVLNVLNITTGALEQSLSPGFAHNFVSFSGDGSLLAVTHSNDQITVYNTTNWSVVKTFDATGSFLTAIAFAPDASVLLVGRSSRIDVYDPEDDFAPLGQLSEMGGRGRTNAIKFTSDSRHVLICSGPGGSFIPGSFRVWDRVASTIDSVTLDDAVRNGDFNSDASLVTILERVDSASANIRTYDVSDFSTTPTTVQISESIGESTGFSYTKDDEFFVFDDTLISKTDVTVEKDYSVTYLYDFRRGFAYDKERNSFFNLSKINNVSGSQPTNHRLYTLQEKYELNDRVQHMGQFWESETNDNLNEPPTNWTDIGYKIGDRVLHNDSLWEAQVDDTTEEPGTGNDWEQVLTEVITNAIANPTLLTNKHANSTPATNLAVNNGVLTNKVANNNGIINKTANPTNLNNV